MSTALVLELAACPAANRLTLHDRIELGRWSEVAYARNERLVLHERLDGDSSDVGNYVALYAAGCCWASWGLSRRPGGIVVWDSATGLDSGRFASMHEALCWVLSRKPSDRDRTGCRNIVGRAEDARTSARWRAGRGDLVEGVGFEPT